MKRTLESSGARRKRLCSQVNDENPEYVFTNNCRVVVPYVFSFSTFTKQRWKGQRLLDIFAKEFAAYSKDYYEHAIVSGKVTVNGVPTTVDYIVKDGDLILHKTHRHEPPVTDQEPTIVYEDDDFIAFNKPASIPVHPCGAYRFNSLVYIIKSMRKDIDVPHFIHRLDRLTSGLIILAKTAKIAKEMSKIMGTSKPVKVYFARVRGHFGGGPVLKKDFVDQLESIAKLKCTDAQVLAEGKNGIRIICPVGCKDQKNAIWECRSDGKASETIVRYEKEIDGTTVVRCEPITGRTHQIRLHLELIGFPIANDPCYGGELNFGENESKTPEITSKVGIPLDYESPRGGNESERDFMKRTCRRCALGDELGQAKVQLHCARIWLHAFQYQIDDRVFATPKPAWTN